MASRILACRDAVKALLVDGLDPAEPDRVKAVYVPKVDAVGWDGWRFWVYPAAYRDAERLSRGSVKKELRVVVEAEIKYDLAAADDEDGLVPPEWVDEQVRYVEENVFNLLNGAGGAAGLLLASRFRTEACEVQAVYDPRRLHEDKVFATLIEITYTEPVTG